MVSLRACEEAAAECAGVAAGSTMARTPRATPPRRMLRARRPMFGPYPILSSLSPYWAGRLIRNQRQAPEYMSRCTILQNHDEPVPEAAFEGPPGAPSQRGR